MVRERATARVRRWLEEDPAIVTWAWTPVEIVSAVERRVREGRLDRRSRRVALDRFEALAASWDEITDVLAVRTRALPLLGRHALRAADAGQLGAALLVADEGPPGFRFVCLDDRLGHAAELEGLRLLGPE